MGEVLDRLDALDVSSRPLLVASRPVLAWLFGRAERAEGLLAESRDHPDPWVRATVPLILAEVAENDGRIGDVRPRLDEALEAFRDVGDRWALSVTLSSLGWLRTLEGDLEGGADALLEGQRILAELDVAGDGRMYQLRLADIRARQGDLEAAREHAQILLDESEGNGEATAMALSVLSRIAWEGGDDGEALTFARRGVDALGPLNDRRPDRRHARAVVCGLASGIERVCGGDPDHAALLLRLAYADAVASKDMPILAAVGLVAADAAHAAGRPTDAAEMLAAAAAVRGTDDPTDTQIARITRELRGALGDGAFDAAWVRGHGLERAAAIARLAPEA
jgi:tetratricopeptide (TPR) repeat protein